jgi:hypothetical protein
MCGSQLHGVWVGQEWIAGTGLADRFVVVEGVVFWRIAAVLLRPNCVLIRYVRRRQQVSLFVCCGRVLICSAFLCRIVRAVAE